MKTVKSSFKLQGAGLMFAAPVELEIKPSDKVSENAIYSWDVSVDKTGKVMAWYEDIDKNELYEVYIGQNGGVKANKDSRFYFFSFYSICCIFIFP